jgi:hypothetical protein
MIMKRLFHFTFLSLTLFFFACQSDTPKKKPKTTQDFQVFSLIDSSESGLNFVNQIEETGNSNILLFDYYYNGSGLAVGDLDNDGLQDILLTGNTTGNRLYRNLGNLKFEDVTDQAGLRQDNWSNGAVMFDINNDGLLDIYISNGGPFRDTEKVKNECYINLGNGRFEERAEALGIAGNSHSSQAAILDYDKDGDLDLFVINYGMHVFADGYDQYGELQVTKQELNRWSCQLYRNENGSSFTNVTEAAGVQKPAYGLGVFTSDINQDGWVDIYVSNDYAVPNFMFINNGDGTFTDQIKQRLDHCSHFSMGTDYADINNDGLQDIAEVDMMPEDHVISKTFMRPMDFDLFFRLKDQGVIPQFMFNSFHIQHGFGVFSDIGHMAGVGKTDWSWATLLADYDNDGWKDYLVTNGIRRNLKNNDFIQETMPKVAQWKQEQRYDSLIAIVQDYPGFALKNYLFRNNRDLTFTNVNDQWGLDDLTHSNGAAFADLDLDGDLELIINNIDQPVFLYRNNTTEQSGRQWMRFKVKDSRTNTIPYNTRIEIKRSNGDILLEELKTVRGYRSAVEPVLHFGFGQDAAIEEIRIIWPDGSQNVLENLETNQVHTIDRANYSPQSAEQNMRSLFQIADMSSSIFREPFQHQENPYLDFNREILLPYRQSTLGPIFTVGDVNGDNNPDFYIGGAKDQPGRLYLMEPSKGYYSSPCQPWEAHAASEDMGGVFFDLEGDGDLDLYVASGGGGEFAPDAPELKDRVYLNDGQGCFSVAPASVLPAWTASGGKVAAADWDQDGDTDLFVAGRTVPGKYPFPAQSVLLENQNGQLKDVTAQKAPYLTDLGMITDGQFHDFSGDGRPDLLLSGEWMTLRLLVQDDTGFSDQSEAWGLSDHNGWWHSLELADIDQDGDQDIIAGNIGLNNKYKIKDDHPIHIFAKDFDNSGTIDIVLSSKYKGSLVPARGRQCSSEQMPFIKEKFPTFSGFANSTLEDIYGAENLESALHYTTNEAHSMVWINQGTSFSPIPLPNAAQVGPILSTQVWDINEDGFPDLLIGGDLADTEPETQAYDGSRGLVLLGRGDGHFDPVWAQQSGLAFGSRNIRDLVLVNPPGNRPGKVLLIAANNDPLQAIYLIPRKPEG